MNLESFRINDEKNASEKGIVQAMKNLFVPWLLCDFQFLGLDDHDHDLELLDLLYVSLLGH